MQTKLVVFDLAGTTVSDNGNVNDAFRKAFSLAGVEVSKAEVDKLMGYRKMEAIEIVINQYLPEQKDKQLLIDDIHEQFNADMVSFYKNDLALKPLPFAEDTFQLLFDKGIKVGLNTGFTRRITNAILERLTWDKNPFISQVICSDEVPEGRPHDYMIKAIMQQQGIDHAANVIKVGDTEVDVLEGRNAGCGLVVSVTTGAYTREQLEGYKPDFIIDSLQELPALIKY